MRYFAILVLALLGTGCMASLGSRAKDQARAEDIGATAGSVATAIPGAAAVGAIGAPAFDLAAREGQRIADAKEAAGEPIGLWASVLLAIGAAGSALLRQRRLTTHIDELYDETHVAIKDVPPPTPPKA